MILGLFVIAFAAGAVYPWRTGAVAPYTVKAGSSRSGPPSGSRARWCNLPMSYALAFTTVPARTYVLAYATALAPVVTIAMIATSWFL